MEELNGILKNIKMEISNFQTHFNNGMTWYKQEMDNLKALLAEKDKEIRELKKQLNEKSSK